jgi:hypothetical protein
MKNIFYTLFALVTVLIFSCNSGNNIIGEWTNTNVEKGTRIVSIVKEKNLYVGRIIKIRPDDIFEIGDIVWKDIEFIEKGKYKYKTIHKYYYTNKIEYVEEYLEMKDDSIFTKGVNKENNKTLFIKNKKR